jgi:superfamily II DNA helicase RecQ
LETVEKLRQFLNDEGAKFKSKEQERGCELALGGEESFICVLPTGGGKSMLYMLAAFTEPDMTTIVMCPNVALLRDQVQRVEACGLTYAVWYASEQEPIPMVHIVFVGLETLASAGFWRWVDEAHMRT